MSRPRLRDLGISIGVLTTGPLNALTDVPGVLVGHTTLIRDEPRVARTGVTMITARDNQIWSDYCFAGWHRFNGNGEMTGIPWLDESGLLGSAIGITNTHQVGLVRDALVRYAVNSGVPTAFHLPVVAETWDGLLNDIDAFHVTEADALNALASATGVSVSEGNVGGGTGMICHEFKGGIGTASRLADTPLGRFTVGVLVQANYGARQSLRIDGVPVGRMIDTKQIPSPYQNQTDSGSIIVIVATDAPLIPVQCRRLARRATVGLARVGGVGADSSGDLFLAFATGNHVPAGSKRLYDLAMLPHDFMTPLFSATAEATEEAILNALCGAEDMTGFRGNTAYALPQSELAGIMKKRFW